MISIKCPSDGPATGFDAIDCVALAESECMQAPYAGYIYKSNVAMFLQKLAGGLPSSISAGIWGPFGPA